MDRASLLTREARELVRPGVFDRHHEVVELMRVTLTSWLHRVAHTLEDGPSEIVQTAAALLDAHMAQRPACKSTLQLIGMTALMIAIKFHGDRWFSLDDAVCFCAETYTKAQFRDTEWTMLATHDFAINKVIPLHFYYLDPVDCHDRRRLIWMFMDVGATTISSARKRWKPSEIEQGSRSLAEYVVATEAMDLETDFTLLHIDVMRALEMIKDSKKGEGIKERHSDAWAHFHAWHRSGGGKRNICCGC